MDSVGVSNHFAGRLIIGFLDGFVEAGMYKRTSLGSKD